MQRHCVAVGGGAPGGENHQPQIDDLQQGVLEQRRGGGATGQTVCSPKLLSCCRGGVSGRQGHPPKVHDLRRGGRSGCLYPTAVKLVCCRRWSAKRPAPPTTSR
jgi:hypothetical protein